MSTAGDDPTPWNLLHDGTVTALARDEDTLLVTIDVPYVRVRFGGTGTFVLRLAGCDGISYEPFDEPLLYELDAIASSQPDLNTTTFQGGAIVVSGNAGVMRLRYANLAITLDTGTDVTLSELAAHVRSYWDDWSARHEPRGSS
ncbi:MAG: hypothetical protein H0X17_04990 [Deltaproteobacteria bacterium]|nr:hypothetical protein [Deltaproteobacteria bacterium]